MKKILLFIVMLLFLGCSKGTNLRKEIAIKSGSSVSSKTEDAVTVKEFSDKELKDNGDLLPSVGEKIVIKSSKESFDADGKDGVIFSIENNLKGDILYFVNDRQIEGEKFTAIKSGVYLVYATFNGIKSNIIKVYAVQKPNKIQIIPDKTQIFGDGKDKVVFTSKILDFAGDEIKDLKGDIYFGSQKLEDGTFSAKSSGLYFFKAIYKGLESDNIPISLISKLAKVELVSDKKEIVNDGIDTAEIITKFFDTNGNDMLGNRKLYLNGESYVGTKFNSTKVGEYIFTAESEGIKSNELKVKVGYVKLPLYIIEQYPITEQVNVPIKVTMRIKFSQKLDKNTINSETIKLLNGNNQIALKYDYDEKLEYLYITPLRKLKYNTSYKLVVTKNLKDITESNTSSDLLFNFTTIKSIKENFIRVKPGIFSMGDETNDLWDDTRPVHNVKINYSYLISKYEVVFDEYDLYCEAMKIKKADDNNMGRAKNAVVSVSWFDAIKYCNWLSEQEDLPKAYDEKTGDLLDSKGKVTRDITKVRGYRLPTEAEWEYAARGAEKGLTKKNLYSGSNQPDIVAWFAGNSSNRIQVSGKKYANELGIFDMSGNAAEWCNDNYEKYGKEIKINPIGAKTGKAKVVRGGSYYSVSYNIRNAYRDNYYPATKSVNIGFRVVKTAGGN